MELREEIGIGAWWGKWRRNGKRTGLEGGSKECRREPVKRRRAPRDICGQLTPGLTSLPWASPPPLDVNSGPWAPTPFSHPFQEARSPQAGAPPPPLLAPRRPVVRRRRDGGGAGALRWGIPAPSPALPQSTPLTGPRSPHRAGKQRELGRKPGPGGRQRDSEGGSTASRRGTRSKRMRGA